MNYCPFLDGCLCVESSTCSAWVCQSDDNLVATKLLTYDDELDLNSVTGVNAAYLFVSTVEPIVTINRISFNEIINKIKVFEGYTENIKTCLTNYAEYYNNVIGYCSLLESAKRNMDNALLSYCNNNVKKILHNNTHIHDAHYHAIPHKTSDKSSGDEHHQLNGVFSPTITPPNILLQEFMTNLDLDGNGMIYGKHFILSNSDKQKPNMLKSIESMPSWKVSNSVVTMTYQEYIDSVGWGHYYNTQESE